MEHCLHPLLSTLHSLLFLMKKTEFLWFCQNFLERKTRFLLSVEYENESKKIFAIT